MRDRLGVRGRLLLAFFSISAFTLLVAGAAMYSFLEVGRTLDRITQHRVPSALASLEISRQAERIVAVAPALLAVTTPDQQAQVSSTIVAEVEHLNELLNDLKKEIAEIEQQVAINENGYAKAKRDGKAYKVWISIGDDLGKCDSLSILRGGD